jgi:tetratricopeptide (TPR) repeat protein
VNRPLRRDEEHPRDNFNKTYYRDQINKVANAISDILTSLKNGRQDITEKPFKAVKGDMPGINRLKTFIFGRISQRLLIILISFLSLSLAAYFIFRNAGIGKNGNKIAVLRLQNPLNDTSLIIPATEFFEAIDQKLILVNSISKIPEFITDRYDISEKSLTMIRKDLKANYILFGKIRTENQEIKITVELSSTRENRVLWSNTYPWSNELLSKTSSEIIKIIAEKMNVSLTPDEERGIDTEASGDPDININYISANSKLKDAWSYYNYGDKLLDSSSFTFAIQSYDRIIKEDTLFALAYAKRAIARALGFYFVELDSSNIEKCKTDIDKALSINGNMSEIEIAQGFYYYYCKRQNELALEHFEKASLMNPDNYQPLFYMALANRRLGNWDACLKLIHKVIKSNPREAIFLTNIGMTYSFFHKFDSALIYNQMSIDEIPGWVDSYKNKIEVSILRNGITSEAKGLIETALRKTGMNMNRYEVLIKMYDKKFAEAFSLAERANPADFSFPGEKYLLMAKLSLALKNYNDAKRYFESARIILAGALVKKPEEPLYHAAIGLAYAGRGAKAKAIEEGERAIQLAAPFNKMEEIEMKIIFAQILTMVEDYESAFPRIINILNTPSFFSKNLLLLDPVWQPILAHRDYGIRIIKYIKTESILVFN